MSDPYLRLAVESLERALEFVRGLPPVSSAGASRDLAQIKIQEALWWTRALGEIDQ